MYSSILFEAEPKRICQKWLNMQYCVTASKSKMMPINISLMYCWIIKPYKSLKSQNIQANIWQIFPLGPKDFPCSPKNTEYNEDLKYRGTTSILFEAEINRIHHTYLKEKAGLTKTCLEGTDAWLGLVKGDVLLFPLWWREFTGAKHILLRSANFKYISHQHHHQHNDWSVQNLNA